MKNVLIAAACLVGVASFAFQALAAPAPPQLEIISIGTDFEENTLIIVGENFDNGSPPVVTFGGIELDVDSYSAIEIVAFPPDPDVQLDDQILTVMTGEDPQQFASLDLDATSAADEEYAIYFRRNV